MEEQDGNRYLQIVTPGVSELRDGPIPSAGRGQVVVRIEAITTCPHWDLHLASGEPMFPGRPLQYPYPPGQPGHEAVGRVVAVGDRVEGLGSGMRVAAWRDPGHQRAGCYARYNVFDADHLLPVPEELPAPALAPLELAMCVQVTIDQLQRGYGLAERRVAVGGLGPAGLIAVQLARAHGAGEVVGIDPVAARRELAASLGAAGAVAPEETSAGRFDLAIDCTGLKVSIEALMDRTDNAVAIFGVLREEVLYRARHRKLSLLGYPGHFKTAAERALGHVVSGALRLQPLVTASLPLRRYAEGVELLRRKRAVKVCYLPWEE